MWSAAASACWQTSVEEALRLGSIGPFLDKDLAAMARQEATTIECVGFLTEDIIKEILIRLPARSLLRFRSVSKQWRNLLSSPNFILAHLQHASQRLLLFSDRDLSTPLRIQSNIFDEAWSPSSSGYSADDLFASCNGLLCFNEESSLKICNPMTGHSLHIVKPVRTSDCQFRCEYAFGFHPKTNKYKIIHFMHEFHGQGSPCRVDSIQVYTLGEEEWREIRVPSAHLLLSLGVVNVDGAMHWITGPNGGCSDIAVMSFDLNEEVFTSVRPPTLQQEKKARYCTCAYSITEIDGKVCFVITLTHSRLQSPEQYNAPGEFNIWMLDCHSKQKWLPMYTIIWPPGFWSTVRPPVFIHGRKVLLQDIGGQLWSYDVTANSCQLQISSQRMVASHRRPRVVHSYFYKEFFKQEAQSAQL
ncbi:putative F-box protein At1g32420 isoform X1 [Lolium perenne]|nr:F-box protein At3g07870-like [Lolium perenne]